MWIRTKSGDLLNTNGMREICVDGTVGSPETTLVVGNFGPGPDGESDGYVIWVGEKRRAEALVDSLYKALMTGQSAVNAKDWK